MQKKTICVVGSGWGAAAFVKTIDTDQYDVVVISPTCEFLYTPLLPFSIFKSIQLTLPMESLKSHVRVLKRNVTDAKFAENRLVLDDNSEIGYDIVVFTHGAVTNTFNIRGLEEHCHFIKTSTDVETIRDKLKHVKPNSNIVVLGCGPAGVETIGHLIDEAKYNITAIDALERPISMYPPQSISYLLNFWEEKNVKYKLSSPVSNVTSTTIYTKTGEVEYDMAFWCGGIKSNALTSRLLFRLDDQRMNGIHVDPFLRVTKKGKSMPDTYAIGDCSVGFGPPTAQKAYQQGTYVANRLNKPNDVPFSYNNKGQVTYIGANKSIYSGPYFTTNGRVACFINKCIIVYNSMSIQQLKNVCKAYIEK